MPGPKFEIVDATLSVLAFLACSSVVIINVIRALPSLV